MRTLFNPCRAGDIDLATCYGSGAAGYTDDPTLDAALA